jgi:hypothetical protein
MILLVFVRFVCVNIVVLRFFPRHTITTTIFDYRCRIWSSFLFLIAIKKQNIKQKSIGTHNNNLSSFYYTSHRTTMNHLNLPAPTENDIISSKNKKYSKEPGNKWYSMIIHEMAPKYETANETERIIIVDHIINVIKHENRRFISFPNPSDTSQWVELCDFKVREKIGHALRHVIKGYIGNRAHRHDISASSINSTSTSQLPSVSANTSDYNDDISGSFAALGNHRIDSDTLEDNNNTIYPSNESEAPSVLNVQEDIATIWDENYWDEKSFPTEINLVDGDVDDFTTLYNGSFDDFDDRKDGDMDWLM